MPSRGTVIGVFRGGCEVVVHGDSPGERETVRELRLSGKHAIAELRLAVGDEVTFDERDVLLECAPRRTELARLAPSRGRRRTRAASTRRVIAANVDRVAIVASVVAPPFRAGAVDRFLLAAAAGGLEAILVVSKVDLLQGAPLPAEIASYAVVVPVHPVSATECSGLDALRTALAASRTVLAGHSGVGKSSLLNALEPRLRLETGALRERDQRGRHTTTAAEWIALDAGAVVIDTPGVREIATGAVDPDLLGSVYPDVTAHAEHCRFRDCAHDSEPGCAVRDAIDAGELAPERLASYRKLLDEIEAT